MVSINNAKMACGKEEEKQVCNELEILRDGMGKQWNI